MTYLCSTSGRPVLRFTAFLKTSVFSGQQKWCRNKRAELHCDKLILFAQRFPNLEGYNFTHRRFFQLNLIKAYS